MPARRSNSCRLSKRLRRGRPAPKGRAKGKSTNRSRVRWWRSGIQARQNGNMQQELDLRHYLGIFRRRWLFLLVPAIVISVGVTVLAYKLPRMYEATATILVESQQIPSNLASST